MNNKLSKIGLLLIAILHCPYILFLISGLLEPNPVTNEKITENSVFVIVVAALFVLLCITGLFIKEKHFEKYRKISCVFAGLRVFFGEFGAFWLSYYEVWQENGVANPLTIFAKLDKVNIFLVLGVILLLFALSLMVHIGALMCFEYGLPEDKRMKKLHICKAFLIFLSVIALIGILTMGAVLYSQTV